MNKRFVIINPIAGTRFRKLNPETIHRIFPATENEITIENTTYAGHAAELASKAVQEQYDSVIIAGGDGSINEVGSVLRNTPVKLGIIPSGSGNGLAHHLDIPIHAIKALEIIKQGRVRPIDVGIIEGKAFGEKCFFSNCGFGYDAEVIHAYSSVKQRGFLTYLYFMFQSIVTLTPHQATIKFDEHQRVVKPFVFTVANSSQYGYNIEVAPNADITDGQLNALLVEDASFFRVLKFAVLSLLQLRDKITDVADLYETSAINIDFDEETKIQIDGEPYIATGRVTVGVEHQALNVFVP